MLQKTTQCLNCADIIYFLNIFAPNFVHLVSRNLSIITILFSELNLRIYEIGTTPNFKFEFCNSSLWPFYIIVMKINEFHFSLPRKFPSEFLLQSRRCITLLKSLGISEKWHFYVLGCFYHLVNSSSSKFIVRLLQNGHRCITESQTLYKNQSKT